MLLCFALALWNGKDPILKERLFGLTNSEGNHGEDVKEYYFYLDSTPTHSYMKYALQVPAGGVPLRAIWSRRTGAARATSSSTSCSTPGVFDEDRYFDVFVEYAKAEPEDILDPHHRRQPRARGGHAAPPAARSGSATPGRWRPGAASPSSQAAPARRRPVIVGDAPRAGHALSLLRRRRRAAVHRQRDQPLPPVGAAEPDRATEGRHQRLRRQRRQDAVNPAQKGTKAAAHTVVDRGRRAERARSACA